MTIEAVSGSMSRRLSVTAENQPFIPDQDEEEGRSLFQRARYCVVWTARIILPIVFLLSIIKPVEIDDLQQIENRSIPQTTAVLLVTHSRADYLRRSLTSILSHHPGGTEFPIVISQDMQDAEYENVTSVVHEFAESARLKGQVLIHSQHAKCYEYENDNSSSPFINLKVYQRITRHYYYALERIFRAGLDGHRIDRVIILEDDIEIAPDFFSYFEALTPILESDPSLLCVSAWNDNGIESLSKNNSQLHRTDFFPGLGWMLTRALWNELKDKWPSIYWDDWMRREEQTLGRQCIRPEVSRTSNFGKNGASQSFHFNKHVSRVIHATEEEAIDFSKLDFTYLEPENYYRMVFERMSKAVQLKFSNYLTSRPQDNDVIAFYPEGGMQSIGKRTGIMIDDRNGVRRTSYLGVIIIPWNGHWAFIVQRGWEPPPGYALGASVCC